MNDPTASLITVVQYRMSILGVPVSLVNLPQTVTAVTQWARGGEPRTIFVREVASLMLAVENRKLRDLHDQASLVVPDGTPLVWIGRLRGIGPAMSRVSGADLVDAVCKASLETGQCHYFYGGKPGVAEEMARRLGAKYPGLRVVGTYSPPMRDIDPEFQFSEECSAELEAIRQSGADFVWIGISSPKQEYWMMKAAPLIGRGVFFGVGAAFDFHSGAVARAPGWMRDNGLEWLHRLLSEPRRLWRRYLLLAPKFVLLLLWSHLIGFERESLTCQYSEHRMTALPIERKRHLVLNFRSHVID
jgi:N-acetylglucosaminyldiphosphoundecaprenol N-acetyl-beta-D-mannosaminyltransferase